MTEDFVIAYEPIWAIGTGLTPTTTDIEQMHGTIRRGLVNRFGARGRDVRILYGGSLRPSNAREILAIENVNGGLIGGAASCLWTSTRLSQRCENRPSGGWAQKPAHAAGICFDARVEARRTLPRRLLATWPPY